MRLRPLVLVLGSILCATVAGAVDVRQPDTGAIFDAGWVRAYAPCLVPNTAARNGAAACDMPLTSGCVLYGSTEWPFDLEGFAVDPTEPPGLVTIQHYGPSALDCDGRDYVMTLGVRTTTDLVPITEPESSEDPACPSRHCTFPDRVLTREGSNMILILNDASGERAPNYELLGATVTAPDGLPVAGFGLARGNSETFTSNLTVAYAPCTAPGPFGACDLVPPQAACDFESGEIHWPQLGAFGAPSAQVTLRSLTGVDPRCTDGTYQLEATVRITGRVCGTASDPVRCTTTDQTVTAPLVAKGHGLDATVALPLGPLGRVPQAPIDTVELTGARILDPTGAVMAVPGLTGVRNLVGTRVAIKGDRLRVRAAIPVNFGSPTIDPTLDGGATITVGDRDGVFYTVTIPEVRWQDQSPLGSRWTYDDPGGVLGGVRKASIKRIAKGGVALGYKLDLRATGVDLSGADFPSMTVHVDVARPLIVGFSPVHRSQGVCTGIIRAPGKLDCK